MTPARYPMASPADASRLPGGLSRPSAPLKGKLEALGSTEDRDEEEGKFCPPQALQILRWHRAGQEQSPRGTTTLLFTLRASPAGRCPYPHLTDEKTEAHEGKKVT